MKFRLSRTFLRFFEVFSRSQAPRKAFKGCCYAVFSGCLCRSRAGQLDYNTTGKPLCQHLFSDFLTFFSDLLGEYDVSSFPSMVGVSYHILMFSVNTDVSLLVTRTIYKEKSVQFDEGMSFPHADLFSYNAGRLSPNSSARIHFRTFRSRRETCTCVVPSTLAVSL